MDALDRMLHWIGNHVRGFYAAIGLFLVLGLALAMLAVVLFAAITRGIAGGLTQEVDESVLRWFHHLGSPWLDGLALVGTALGSGAALCVTLLLGTVFFWRSRHHYSALLLWVSLLGGRFLSSELKLFFDRPRPSLFEGDLRLLGWTFSFPRSPSFPSGHAVTSVVIFGTLTYLIVRLEPTPRMRRPTFAVSAVLVLLIGLSRIYLGVHYPSDVLAGYLAGTAWATFCALGIEAVRYFRSREPGVEEEEADLENGIRPIREAFRT